VPPPAPKPRARTRTLIPPEYSCPVGINELVVVVLWVAVDKAIVVRSNFFVHTPAVRVKHKIVRNRGARAVVGVRILAQVHEKACEIGKNPLKMRHAFWGFLCDAGLERGVRPLFVLQGFKVLVGHHGDWLSQNRRCHFEERGPPFHSPK